MTKIAPSLQTASGHLISLLDPDPAMIEIADIAMVLGRIGRYAGHSRFPYSVAEHSVLITRWLQAQGCSVEVQKQGLLHDAPEYLVGDNARPLKELIGPPMKQVETRIWNAVCSKFGLFTIMFPEVKEADNRILFDEKAVVFKHDVDWGWSLPALGVEINFWSAEVAEFEFMNEFNRLFG